MSLRRGLISGIIAELIAAGGGCLHNQTGKVVGAIRPQSNGFDAQGNPETTCAYPGSRS